MKKGLDLFTSDFKLESFNLYIYYFSARRKAVTESEGSSSDDDLHPAHRNHPGKYQLYLNTFSAKKQKWVTFYRVKENISDEHIN